MSKNDERDPQTGDPSEAKTYTRRDFLKIAGVTGATLGAAGGLGGLLAACGGGATTTTTTAAGPTTTAAASTTTTVAQSTTTVSAVQTGREIKIGFVTPLTGPLASFGVPDNYCVSRAKAAFGTGIMCGDGQMHPISITTADSQSDSARAASVAGDLINNGKVDMIVAASTPDTVVPVADQAEAAGVPCLTTDCPWQSYVGSRTSGDLTKTFQWTYHVFWGAEDVAASMLDAWGQMTTNKVIATMFPNDADGNALRPVYMPLFKAAGYTVVDGGAFQDGTDDFSTQIAAFKKAGAEIGTGIFIPPDFTNFWKQAAQQGWKPSIATYTKALLFPQSVEALGDIANNLTTEVWWSPNHPFTSPLLKQSAKDFAADFQTTAKQEWTQPLLHFLVFDWAADVLTRTTSVDDKTAIMTAVKATKMETVGGKIDFTEAVQPAGPPWKLGPCHVAENVYKSPLVLGQWVKSTTYPFDLNIVDNVTDTEIPVAGKIQPYTGA